FSGGLLLRLLVGDALLLQLRLAQRSRGGVGLLFLGALGNRGLGIGDGGLEARQRRRLVVGLLHQRVKALGLDDVLAADALLGGDEDVGHQVGERAGNRRIAGLLLAQRQVVLHGVVALRRVRPLLAQRLAGGFAQLVDVHRPDLFGGSGLGRCLLGFGRRPRAGRGRVGTLFLLAPREREGDHYQGRDPDQGRACREGCRK